ncbi:hypothetical protein NW752_006680 [Fusarium irregulare]|uniref:Uncharacterized protein n=1 Tax=Fusarium irregulare TaxID=2494466 RepID=A0A9W8PSN0_9HYPO|nr:hypothetical protein NW766_005559 [Fusarium irregulare]KAJ4015759.1 hypothetical protein NW752_006680 [Fusarium irregulare]
MSTTNDPMRETPVRPSQQSLEDILQGVQDVEARLGKTVKTVKEIKGTVKGIKETVQGINAKLDKTIENIKEIDASLVKTLETLEGIDCKVDKTFEKRDELDKKLRDSIQSVGAKFDERFDEFEKKLDQLGNFIAIFTAAPNTTFERAKL